MDSCRSQIEFQPTAAVLADSQVMCSLRGCLSNLLPMPCAGHGHAQRARLELIWPLAPS